MAGGNLVPAFVAAGVAAAVGAGMAVAFRAPPAAAPPPPPSPIVVVPDVTRRVEALERRIAEVAAAVEALRKEGAAARAAAEERETAFRAEIAREREAAKVDPAQSLISGYTGEPKPGAEEKKPGEMDAFAKALAKSMRQGIGAEMKKMWDLVLDPTPEALEARKRQLKLFANALGNNAGLDQAQIATFERILNDTDEKARRDLRPVFEGVDDYRNLDYKSLRKFTEDSFSSQDEQFDRELPKDKAESLKRQMEPIRHMFTATLDEMGKASAAAAESPK